MPTLARKLIKYSQFQLKVLDLYAQFVRLSKNKPGLLNTIRLEFRQNSKLNIKNDSLLIDYKIRRANNQLEMLKKSRVSSVKTLKLENKNNSNTI
jgi:hypothetical protein